SRRCPGHPRIANLFPPAPDLRAALRVLLDRWLGHPARALGYERWGFKEVRLGAAEAVLLQWLYPAASFVVCTRNPFDCYCSVKGSARDWRLYARWPDRRVDCVTRFARHWNSLATSWANAPLDTAPRIVRHEELEESTLSALAGRLGLDVDPSPAFAARVGGTARRVTCRRSNA